MNSVPRDVQIQKCSDGTPLRSISPQKHAAIAAKYYDRHHEMLTDMVNEKIRSCGSCVIIDAHSFPAVPLPYEACSERPDFCLGTDSFHTPHALLHTCSQLLKGCGFKVGINRPFSGTMVPMEHLYSDTNVSSIMIEVNRRLYMTPDGRKTDMFPVIQRVLAALVEEIERAVP